MLIYSKSNKEMRGEQRGQKRRNGKKQTIKRKTKNEGNIEKQRNIKKEIEEGRGIESKNTETTSNLQITQSHNPSFLFTSCWQDNNCFLPTFGGSPNTSSS